MAFNFSKATSASAASEAGATPSTPSTQPLDQVQTTAPAVQATQVDNAQPIQQTKPNILKLAGTMKVIPIVQDTSQINQATQTDSANNANNANNSGDLSDSQLYQTQIITTNLATLKAKLEAKIPDLHDNIRIIMKSLQSDPVQVTILTNEERSILFRSMSTIADVDLVLDAAKAAKKKIDLTAPENANLFE